MVEENGGKIDSILFKTTDKNIDVSGNRLQMAHFILKIKIGAYFLFICSNLLVPSLLYKLFTYLKILHDDVW